MSFVQGLTFVKVNSAILVQNTSSPRFDRYSFLSFENGTSTVIDDNFVLGATLVHSFSTPGTKVMSIVGERILRNSYSSATFSATLSVGYAPDFYFSYTKYTDQSTNYSGNYVITGNTFAFQIIEGNTATSPKTYTWNYAGGTTYSGSTSNVQVLKFNDTSAKVVGLTITNNFGSMFSNVVFNPVSTPILNINPKPTFGNVRITNDILLTNQFSSVNGHLYEDVNVLWQIAGQTYTTTSVNFTFGSTGIKGVTLFYISKILNGLSGSTYGQYNVLQPQFSMYYDPELMIAFDRNEPDYAYYANEMKKYATEYTYLTPVSTGVYASSTYYASIAAFDSFTPEQRARPVLINAEYPWLVILYRKDNEGVDSSWATNPTVIQEAQRQGVSLTGLTLSGYKELAIKCWKDIVDTLRSKGCPKLVHYASTVMPFSDYTSIPNGMLEYGPLSGVTTNHYWYEASKQYNPSIRDKFESGITGNAFGALLKAQSNADANGAAAYSFIPNSPAGLCGISYWASSDIVLLGYSGGSTFINATDFTDTVLEEATKVTSAKMWIEFYRACLRTADLGYCSATDIPSKVAAIVTLSIPAAFSFTNPGGGWRSRFKFHGSAKKDPEKTAANEIGAIFETNYRIKYSDYSVVKKPDEIWIWDARKYYNINVPSLFVSNPGAMTQSKIETLIMRNALEIEFFGRPELSAGNSLWYTGSTADNITYYTNNSLSNYFWNNPNSAWW
jgi:hypothetical protein